MEEVELRPINMHWVGDDSYQDCCVHGGIYLRLRNRIVSDGSDDNWSISTAAYNFLRSLYYDHPLLGEEPLIPHCGFTMWIVEGKPDDLWMPNCNERINWAIRRKNNQVIHQFTDGTTIEVSEKRWREAVCRFADEIEKFFHTAWPKVIRDEEDRRGFEHFMNIWQQRRKIADATHAGPGND